MGPLLLLLGGAAGLVLLAYALRPDETSDVVGAPQALERDAPRAGRVAEVPLSAPPPQAGAPRVGVWSQDDQALPPLGTGPWEQHVPAARAAEGTVWTGDDALAMLGERFYVRAHNAEELEALRGVQLGRGAPSGPVSLRMAMQRIEAAGWKVVVRDPLLLVTRAAMPSTPAPRTPPGR